MKRAQTQRILIALVMLMAPPLQASTINYSATNLGGNSWQYDYSFTASAPLIANEGGFTIYFDSSLTANLTEVGAPVGWDTIILDNFLGLTDLAYDALSLNGLGAGETAGLFSLQFDWLDPAGAMPSDQLFEVYSDSANAFTISETGTASVVPVPAALYLFVSALAGLGWWSRRRRS